MKYEIKVLEPTDLWYVQNNINPETNKFYHPTKNIPLVQQVEINLKNSGVIIQKGTLHWCMGKLTSGVYKTDNRLKYMWVSLIARRIAGCITSTGRTIIARTIFVIPVSRENRLRPTD